MRQLILLISSTLYVGYIPWASGTFATALAIVFYLPSARFNVLPIVHPDIWIYLAITAAIIIGGTWAADRAEKIHNEKDSHKIVIDEVAGYFVTMILLPTTWFWIFAGFFAFRFFDVWKPGPIRRLQFLKGGTGVMIDDVLAGAMACAVLHAIRLVGVYSGWY
jgi:phosphatidylglycerophosphatase A